MFSPPIDTLLIFALTTPVIGWITERVKKVQLCGAYSTLGLVISLWYIYELFGAISTGGSQTYTSFFSSQLRIDMLGVFMATIFVLIGIFASVYSLRYLERDTGIPLFYSLLLLMISGMVGTVFAGDFFTFFVFWEMMCISSYTLVAFRKQRWEPIEAAFKYLIMSSAGSATLLFGMSILYGMCGTLNFQGLALALSNVGSSVWLYVSAIFILIGLGVKSAIVPLHTWLPDAHSAAPSPISAMLSGVVVETGIYAICRVGFTILAGIEVQWLGVLAILSLVTMFVGNLTPLLQTDLKRLLAYSSIGHIGYMLAGLATGTVLGLTGTLMHIFNHGIMKGAAFLCAGMILYRLETREMKEMAGIGRKMPVTAAIFALSLFALTGMPPLNGFISELTIIMATVEANMAWLGIAVIVNSVISAAYYLRTIKALLQPITQKKVEEAKEGPLVMLIPLLIMAGLIIVLGIFPDILINFARSAAIALLGGG
ncbi:MAG: NADH-quinone oxidoreductase subunit M [Candidatus Methanomethylicaceae archaeon]|nr:NADH-quinone oxidoreductase subunit M [Candidatus Verstraetearchaeota archaeon]